MQDYGDLLHEARQSTDTLFDEIRPAARYERPIPERHRLAFYVGHLEAFDWNLLRQCLSLPPSRTPALDQLFAFGIDPPMGAEPQDQPEDWPSWPQVLEYVNETRRRIDEHVPQTPSHVLEMLLEHRWMHRETLDYLLHQLSLCGRRVPESMTTHADGPPVETGMVPIPAGHAVLGAPDGVFAWDNERSEQRVFVNDFRISRYKITNGEYLKFVHEGGAPSAFWVQQGTEWFYKGMDGLIPLPLDWPVYATKDQADAFAAWRGQRLPTEAEYHRAAYGDYESALPYPWGHSPVNEQVANADLAGRDLWPVTATPGGDSPFGVAQTVGNGWEWTQTPFEPFPGFRIDPLYPGYSKPFFDGEHFVVKGASPATSVKLIRPSFRNWFRHDYPYAYVSFRTVED